MADPAWIAGARGGVQRRAPLLVGRVQVGAEAQYRVQHRGASPLGMEHDRAYTVGTAQPVAELGSERVTTVLEEQRRGASSSPLRGDAQCMLKVRQPEARQRA